MLRYSTRIMEESKYLGIDLSFGEIRSAKFIMIGCLDFLTFGASGGFLFIFTVVVSTDMDNIMSCHKT